MNSPLVSILIATRNNADIIDRCLKSVIAQTYQNIEIIIINDASTDNTLEVVQSIGRTETRSKTYSLEKSGGCPGARNEAMRRGVGEIYAFLDADATAAPNWIELMLKPFESPDVAVVGGPDSVPEECTLVARCIDYSMHSIIATGGLRRGSSNLSPYLPAGCNMLVRKSVVDQVGMFDGTMLWRGEEKEFLYRVLNAGHKIEYIHEARIWHFRRTTLKAFWRQMLLSGVARIDIIERIPSSMALVHFVPGILVAYLIIGFICALISSAFASLYWAAVFILLGVFIVDGYFAYKKLGRIEALYIATLTTAICPIGYGLGILLRLAGWPQKWKRMTK